MLEARNKSVLVCSGSSLTGVEFFTLRKSLLQFGVRMRFVSSKFVYKNKFDKSLLHGSYILESSIKDISFLYPFLEPLLSNYKFKGVFFISDSTVFTLNFANDYRSFVRQGYFPVNFFSNNTKQGVIFYICSLQCLLKVLKGLLI